MYLILSVCCGIQAAQAQVWFNNGAVVGITDNCAVIANGSVRNGATSQLSNKGDFHIEGNFENDLGATADGFSSGLGNYRVRDNWVNNGVFNADQSSVYLSGATQQITGNNVTTFHNLITETPGSVKTQTIDANVKGVLTLNQNELATADYILTIQNASPAAIVQNGVNSAFVSSTNNGRLVRNTNSTQEYIFPTGIQNAAAAKIRELSVTPTNADPRSYSVRYAENPGTSNTTTADGYNIANKAGTVTLVNDNFYHLVRSSDQAPAALSIFYDKAQDNTWKGIGRWQNVPEWQDLASVTESAGQAGSGRFRLSKSAWIPSIKDTAYALINTQDVKVDFNFPTVFAPGSTSAKPEDTYFTIINQADLVTLEELSVFNRWGEMVFNSKRDGTDRWNGQYQGKLQQQANYVFLATVRNKQSGALYPTVTGNVALVW